MMKKWLCGALIGMLALASGAVGAEYTDAATNYPGGSWTNGSNGGMGFDAWAIVADGGSNGWAGCGIWNSAGAGLMMGEAFGYVGKVGHVTIDRDFSQALNTNDSFELDFGVNWDSDTGNKGFSLFSHGTEVINVNHGGYPGNLTMNGANAFTNYGTNTMHWTFTQVAANQIWIYATGRNGVDTYSTTVTTANAWGYLGAVRFYSSGLAADAPDQRQSYFDHLKLIQSGTPPPEPMSLTFSSGTWNPAALGDYPFELTREGAVSNEIVLTSSNTNSVTVPASVSFTTGSNTVSFNATVVSLTAGPATLIASNVATGVWAEYNVTPVAPNLSFSGGTWNPSTVGAYPFELTRVGGVGDAIALSSTDTNVLTVPASVSFTAGSNTVSFNVTVVSLTAGNAKVIATNTASGAWAEYEVKPVSPAVEIGPITVTASSIGFAVPAGQGLYNVYGADSALVSWPWPVLVSNADYTVSGGVVTISTTNTARRSIRIGVVSAP